MTEKDLEDARKERDQQVIKELKEHRDVLLNVRAVLETASGRHVFAYMFKEFEVGELPPMGWPQELMSEKIGSLRVGHSIFKLVCEANAEMAASLLAKVEKEKYAQVQSDS